MNNMQWNNLFSVFFSAEEQGIEIPFALRTSIGEFGRPDTHWEKFGSEWKNCRDYESIKIWLTDDNRELVLGTLKDLGLPHTPVGSTVVVSEHGWML